MFTITLNLNFISNFLAMTKEGDKSLTLIVFGSGYPLGMILSGYVLPSLISSPYNIYISACLSVAICSLL